MGIWIAVFITFAVLGSVLWIKPSPREKLLMEYRQLAMAKGLKVRMLDQKLATQLFPWIENYRPYVFYEKNLPVSAKPSSAKPIVVRVSDNPDAHEIDEVDPVRQAIQSRVGFEKLPDTAEAIVISASGISVLWREVRVEGKTKETLLEELENYMQLLMKESDIWT